MTQPTVTGTRPLSAGPAVADSGPSRDITVVGAIVGVGLLGINQPLAAGVTTGTLMVVALAPVWIGTLRRFRFAILIMVMAVLALVWGAVLTQFQTPREFDSSLATQFALGFITGLGGLGLLLWARTVLPTHQVAIIFGLGYLVRMAEEAPSSVNPWKYQLSVPIAILLLALASRSKKALPTVLCLLGLGLVSVFADSRSFFGFCLLAAVLVMWQHRPSTTSKRMNKLAVFGLLAVALFALYSVGTTLLVQGYLGQANQQRTVQQIEDSGSLLIGGRPEWAGTLALMREQPMGFGLGTVPTSQDVWAAKAGMRAIGTDTENGYVNNYMFGGHFTLHSIVADMRATFGIVGFALGLIMLFALVYSLIEQLSNRTATGLVCLFAALGVCDLAFGPIYKNLPDVMFALAVTLTASAFGTATTESPTDSVEVPAVGGSARA